MKKSLMLVLTSVSGNILEWYDFALYGYFASVIAMLFFPSKNEYVSLMVTFGVFASGFIVRPFGGAFFGYIGDRYGRRAALILSILLMGIPTTLMGMLPSYHSIGLTAPIIFTALRFFQGIAVSGELTGSGVFLVESAPDKKKGFYGSLIMCSTYVGLLLGSACCAIVTIIFSKDQVVNFAWRIPFLLSFLFSAIVFVLRMKCSESPMYIDIKHQNNLTKNPIKTVISGYFPQTILIFLLSSSLAVSIYLLIGYFPTFFVSIMKVPLRESMIISFLGLFSLSIFVPIFGLLSDLFNKKALHGLGAFGFLTCSYLIFHLAMGKNISFLIMSEILIALFIAPIAGSLISMLSEMFPTNVRYTGVSIGYNIGMAIFGGVTPLIAMYLTNFFQSSLAPSYYLSFVGAITLLSLLLIRPNYLEHIN